MSLTIYVLGVDPGPTTGLVGLSYTFGKLQRASIIQCDHVTAREIVNHLVASVKPVSRLVLAVERFVVGPRATRSSTPKAGQITRELVELCTVMADEWGTELRLRSASEVKPWATNARLAAAGLSFPGSAHAADAGRHALFSAVADCGMPDPLSRRGT